MTANSPSPQAVSLAPCPMCGGEATLLDYEAKYGGLHYASRCPQCTSCGCSMGYLPIESKAIAAWNRRASPADGVVVPREAMKEALSELNLIPAPLTDDGEVTSWDARNEVAAGIHAAQTWLERALATPPSPALAATSVGEDDVRRRLITCIEQWDGEMEYDAEDRASLADDILHEFNGPPVVDLSPPSADTDKLRIAREALEPFANLGVSSGPDDEPCHYAYRITRGAIRNARQALARLSTTEAGG